VRPAIFSRLSFGTIWRFPVLRRDVGCECFYSAQVRDGKQHMHVDQLGNHLPRTLRSFTFNAPGPGRAHVTFNGSVVCSNAPNASFAIIDVITQITTAPNATAVINGLGGLRFAQTMFGTGSGVSNTFNISSSPGVSYTSGGPKTVYFRITNRRLDATITCSFYNMTFVVSQSVSLQGRVHIGDKVRQILK
jgi:hypothetical protein